MLNFLTKTLRSPWTREIIEWAVYILFTSIALFISDVLIDLIFFDSNQPCQNPYEMALRTFPHPDLPENQTQTLREVLFITHKLRSALEEVLLPEEATDEDLWRYDQMTKSLETRGDLSWLVLEESNAAKLYNACRGREESRLTDGRIVSKIKPRTADEQRLEAKYAIFRRLKRLHQYYNSLTYGERELQEGDSADRGEYKRPNSWAPEFVEDRLPPFKPQPDGVDETEHFVLTNLNDKEKADELYDDLMKRRNRAIAYLKIHPPKPEGWAPRRSDAWEMTSQVDLETGKLHGKPEYWKPLYGSWGMEYIPTMWKERPFTEEEQKKENEAIKERHHRYQARRTRKEEYLDSVTQAAE